MGRPKQFDRDEVLAKATELFHRHGFSATSTRDLVEVLEINRKSLYAEFGSKQGLFEAVLGRYDEITIGNNFGPLETSNAGLGEVADVIRLFAGAARGQSAGLGCLLCNTAVERAHDEPTQKFIEHYFRRMTAAFHNALKNAQRRSEIGAKVDTLTQARFLTSTVLGIAVLVRAKAAAPVVEAAANGVLSHLTSLK